MELLKGNIIGKDIPIYGHNGHLKHFCNFIDIGQNASAQMAGAFFEKSRMWSRKVNAADSGIGGFYI